MRTRTGLAAICGSLCLLLIAGASGAPPKVQFSKQVLPVLRKECASCHAGSAAPGGYSLETPQKLFAGGRHGAAVVPGKSGQGTLVKYLTGELKPVMPPGKPLDLETINLIRRWIDEGARIDGAYTMTAPVEAGGIMRGAMPMTRTPQAAASTAHRAFLPAAVRQSAPVTALAFSPDGKLLAAGGYRAVRLLNPETGEVLRTLPGPADQVLSVAWSADGKHLAGAGGVPGAFGEVCVWEVPASGDWPKPRVLKEHADAITAVAWRPGAAEFGTASLDKTVRIWDSAAGTVSKLLKDHVDAVFGLVYSPDGKWLATGSADRTLKLYQTDTRTRVSSFTNGEGVTAVAFSAKSDLIAAACADKKLWVWPVKPGTVENPVRRHDEGEVINAVAFSADGTAFAWGAANRKVRLWNGEVSSHRREMNDAPDWVYSVALSPDGKTLAAGAGDGKVYFWSASEGKLLRSVPLGSTAPVEARR